MKFRKYLNESNYRLKCKECENIGYEKDFKNVWSKHPKTKKVAWHSKCKKCGAIASMVLMKH